MNKLLIHGGMVVDGTGSLGIKADIAIDDRMITEIAPVIDSTGREILDAEGMVIAPGFIDIHSHTDATIFTNPYAESKLFQGVTTEVVGNCGIGIFPVKSERIEELTAFLKMHGFSLPEGGISWSDFSGYATVIEKMGIGLNLAPLVSHGALRLAAMGSENRQPTASEMAAMKLMLRNALSQGAWGLSTGLIYPPGSYAKTDELIELGKVLTAYDAIFTSHVRGESETLLDAIDEVIKIGESSGVRVEVSHLKAIGEPNWGKGKLALDLIEAARQRGVQIGADQYPYEASSTTLSVLVPAWAHDGGVEAMLHRLVAPQLQEQIATAISKEIKVRGGPHRIMIAGVGSERNRKFTGKTLMEIASIWKCSPEIAVVNLLVDEAAIVSAIYFSISEADLEYIMASLEVAIGSDGRGIEAQRNLTETVHPRCYGTFARVLGTFVREKKLLSLEQAIYKMTGLPAMRLKMKKRGLICNGFAADLVVFDAAVVKDLSEYSNPHCYAIGNRYVIVNGQVVIEEGRLTGKAPGQVLCKK
jgi:N-acyl-D-amino-acid deacylase